MAAHKDMMSMMPVMQQLILQSKQEVAAVKKENDERYEKQQKEIEQLKKALHGGRRVRVKKERGVGKNKKWTKQERVNRMIKWINICKRPANQKLLAMCDGKPRKARKVYLQLRVGSRKIKGIGQGTIHKLIANE